ncbi:hypothetical protein A3K86_21660 [Photobacterium jeanii]|uniref:Uncharacterized protein n=1 Tax=Photobacterium jeanii TaxID=858640 RepID=A0A178K357_9GAMM|nr:hypothetical protein [Photobacterium jeanii]OAN11536.1 hypothetical protein A3K86_21660 [Photobacterium jeanii]PST91055.1 hypothetical protein C9I91_10765 [Photobacterium jeanii]
MYLWVSVSVVIALVIGSIFTTGIVSAVLDVIAFMILAYVAVTKVKQNKQQGEQGAENKVTPSSFGVNPNKDKFDITP